MTELREFILKMSNTALDNESNQGGFGHHWNRSLPKSLRKQNIKCIDTIYCAMEIFLHTAEIFELALFKEWVISDKTPYYVTYSNTTNTTSRCVWIIYYQLQILEKEK